MEAAAWPDQSLACKKKAPKPASCCSFLLLAPPVGRLLMVSGKFWLF